MRGASRRRCDGTTRVCCDCAQPAWENRPAPTKGAAMESSSPTRVLVVANKTAATPALMQAVRERAARRPTSFTLLVPNTAHGLHKVMDPEDHLDQSEAEYVIELAQPLLEEAAGGPVDAIIGDPEPLAAIQDAVNLYGFERSSSPPC